MKPREKAIELLSNYAWILRDNGNYPEVAKQCALMAVNEILFVYKSNWNIDNSYWLEVKIEIEKL